MLRLRAILNNAIIRDSVHEYRMMMVDHQPLAAKVIVSMRFPKSYVIVKVTRDLLTYVCRNASVVFLRASPKLPYA